LNSERLGCFNGCPTWPGPLERFRKVGIVIVTGRHPPSPRAWPANARRNRRLRRLRLIFCIRPASRDLPGTLTFQRALPSIRQYGQYEKEAPMNWDRVEGNWKQLKGQVRQQWGSLTNDDLDIIEGKRTELSGRLQKRYGIAKDEAERQIDAWLNTIH
jgi:uncharacterized protein YjbJ (UPF0337 family)